MEEKEQLMMKVELLSKEKEEKEKEIEGHVIKLKSLEHSKSQEISQQLTDSAKKEKQGVENYEKLEEELAAMRKQLAAKDGELNKLKNRQSDAIYDFDRF